MSLWMFMAQIRPKRMDFSELLVVQVANLLLDGLAELRSGLGLKAQA